MPNTIFKINTFLVNVNFLFKFLYLNENYSTKMHFYLHASKAGMLVVEN